MLDMEKLDKICDEIEELEQGEMTWSNLEKLSILYNIEHHTRKKMEMGENEGGSIGFSIGGSREGSRSGVSTRELREMANHMNTQQLRDVIVSYGRELNQNGNNSSYNRLYNRMRRYDNGNS